MPNKRIYDLRSVDNYEEAKNYSMMLDGANLPSAKKVGVNTFADATLVNSGFNTLNVSASNIVSEINDFRSKIPTILTGFNNNVYVSFDDNSKVYTFTFSSYSLDSLNTDVLAIQKNVSNNDVNFKLSANTYTKSYIDEELSKLRKDYLVVGGNNIEVECLVDEDENDTSTFQVSFKDIYVNVDDKSVAINDTNQAKILSLSQGKGNIASGNSIAQGSNNEAYDCSLAQGDTNVASGVSLSQGESNESYYVSFAQGNSNYAKNVSVAQGMNNYAENGSISFGGYSTAMDNSFAYGGYDDTHNKTESYDHSIAIGTNSYASGYSYNFYGNSALDHSFVVGPHGLVSGHVTAFGTYNEPKYVSGNNPYTFALGNGTLDNPHTYFRIDTKGVYFSSAKNAEINLAEEVVNPTVVCSTLEIYESLKNDPNYKGKVFIVG